MTQANMHEAKSRLSQLADLAHSGEKVVIAKSGKPYVDLVPHQEEKPRVPGGYHVDMSAFDQSDSEVTELFYGESD